MTDIVERLKEYSHALGTIYPQCDGEILADDAAQIIVALREKIESTDAGFLFKALGAIVDRIESCGASDELTRAVSLASDLRQAIGSGDGEGNKYAKERVLKELGND